MKLSDQKTLLRRQLRTQRSKLSLDFCQSASQQIAGHLLHLHAIQTAKHLAYYWPSNQECDARLLVEHLHSAIETYLPVIRDSNKSLEFYAYQLGENLIPNQFNIPEPIIEHKNPIPIHNLDVILMPLLGFDEQGHRLGMGGGYYDRTLSGLNNYTGKRPVLIGLAYELQKLSYLPHDSWDIDLDYIVTELGLYKAAG